jgi:hypothetical protein
MWNKAISTSNANLTVDYAFIVYLRKSLIDEFTQEWRTISINITEVLNLYKYVKDTLEWNHI